MKAFLYCDPRSINKATTYYVNVIRESLAKRGYEYEVVHKLGRISDPDIIITITERYFVAAKLRYPKVKTIYWSQGVGAEESKTFKGAASRLRYLFRRIAEPMAVNKSDILFCVSDAMVRFFKQNYGLKDHGQIVVMPCYNMQPTSQGEPERYSRPTFVYAGNASSWQCIDTMLDVYANIEKEIPEAELKIFSNCKSEFLGKINDRGIKNYSIQFMGVDELGNEMLKYKYGFVIRDNHVINRVATPTKLNSYLASYLIPIFSNGVEAFAENINLGEFKLMARCPLDAKEIAQRIINFEKADHDFSIYPEIVNKIFKNYFNDSIYQSEFEKRL